MNVDGVSCLITDRQSYYLDQEISDTLRRIRIKSQLLTLDHLRYVMLQTHFSQFSKSTLVHVSSCWWVGHPVQHTAPANQTHLSAHTNLNIEVMCYFAVCLTSCTVPFQTNIYLVQRIRV